MAACWWGTAWQRGPIVLTSMPGRLSLSLSQKTALFSVTGIAKFPPIDTVKLPFASLARTDINRLEATTDLIKVSLEVLVLAHPPTRVLLPRQNVSHGSRPRLEHAAT